MARLSGGELGDVESVMVLSSRTPLFQGHQRLVFQHPDEPDQLVKVMRGEYVRNKFGPTGSFHNRNRRCRQYHPFLRELREYLVACARSPRCLPFLQEILGLVWTDLGVGLVVRKVAGRSGAAAPSLDKLSQQGPLTLERQHCLEAFLEALQESDVVVDDLNSCNMVLGLDPAGNERFVLIDGIGSSTLIPLKAWVPVANRWSKRRRFDRLRAQLIAKGVLGADKPR